MTLSVEGLSHQYGTEPAISDISFEVAAGELVALVGPSGCGKTTIVQAIAGHTRPTAGSICLRGREVTDTAPEEREVGIVFQQSTLYPHMTVAENVAYGLAARDIEPARREEIVTEYLALVDLADQRESYPSELSGGQQRRVELARALAPEPDVLLLDEPLSALDRTLRLRLRDEIARIQRETGVTTLFVTHDQEEAMSLADRLVVLQEGRLSAVGEPRELYQSPPNRFTASFLGRTNTLSTTLVDRDPPTVEIGSTQIVVRDLPEKIGTAEPTVHLRPEAVVVTTDTPETEIMLPGVVKSVSDIGNRYDIHIRLTSGDELVAERRRSPPAVDRQVSVGFDHRDLIVFPGPIDDNNRKQSY